MASSSSSFPTGRRPPLAERRRAQRRLARLRVAQRTTRPLALALHGPAALGLGRRTRAARWIAAALWICFSAAMHGAMVGAGLAIGGSAAARGAAATPTRMEMRPREPAPAPKPVAPAPPRPPPPPPPQAAPPPRPPPPRPTAPPPPPPPPKAELSAEPDEPPPPAPAVGLSAGMTADGAGGPAFAVGDLRAGETAAIAPPPRPLAPPQPGDGPPEAPPAPPHSRNRVARAIPLAGHRFVQPSRRRPSKPPYPAALKSQGIEADVTVVVQLDDAGHVSAVEIVQGSGYPDFDAAARTAALAESFAPATRDGVGVAFSLSFTYRFRLETS